MHPIDLLPDLKIRRREQLVSSLPRLLLVAVLLWVLVLGGLYAWVYTEKLSTQSALEQVQQQVQALEPVAQRVEQVSFLNGKVAELRRLLETNVSETMVPALDLLASLLPPQVDVVQVRMNGNSVQIACESSALAPIGLLQQNLMQHSEIEDVQLAAIRGFEETVGEQDVRVTITGYTFSVSFTYKGAK